MFTYFLEDTERSCREWVTEEHHASPSWDGFSPTPVR
jgi:hypothetical protein